MFGINYGEWVTTVLTEILVIGESLMICGTFSNRFGNGSSMVDIGVVVIVIQMLNIFSSHGFSTFCCW